jgi:hypothetical protein
MKQALFTLLHTGILLLKGPQDYPVSNAQSSLYSEDEEDKVYASYEHGAFQSSRRKLLLWAVPTA